MSASRQSQTLDLSEFDTSDWTYERTIIGQGISSDIYKEGRQCCKCGILQPWINFNTSKKRKKSDTGYVSNCRPCQNKVHKKSLAEKPARDKLWAKKLANAIANPLIINPRLVKGYIVADNGRECSQCEGNPFKPYSEFNTIKGRARAYCKICHDVLRKITSDKHPKGRKGYYQEASKKQRDKHNAERADGWNIYKNKIAKDFHERHPDYYDKWHEDNPNRQLAWDITDKLQCAGLIPIYDTCNIPGCDISSKTINRKPDRDHFDHRLPHVINSVCKRHHNQFGGAKKKGKAETEKGEFEWMEVHLLRPELPYTVATPTLEILYKTVHWFLRLSKLPHNYGLKRQSMPDKYKVLPIEKQKLAFQREIVSLYFSWLKRTHRIKWTGCVITGELDTKLLEHHHDQGYKDPFALMAVVELRKDIHSVITHQFNNSITKYLEYYRLDAQSEFANFNAKYEFEAVSPHK